MSKKYYLIVFGCQMNSSDGEKLEKFLLDLGYVKSPNEASADVIAVVACSIRQSAIDRIYGKAHIWKKRRFKGNLKTILSGCVLEHDRKKLSALFDFVADIKDLAPLKKYLSQEKAVVSKEDYLSLPVKRESNFQAYVPIMSGCNNFCSYCVVPYVRGREKSRSAREIINECQNLISNGYKEITLLGQNVNSYRSGKYNFPKLLKKIDGIKALPAVAPLKAKLAYADGFGRAKEALPAVASAKEGDYWLRFVTSHPKNLSDDLIAVMKSGKHITPYLHLAVQSGDDEILRAMNRKHTASHFLKIVEDARQAIPQIMISTDIIVGFPGETRKQFQNTIKLFKKAKFDMAYISEFSPRPGTVAAQMKDNVSKTEKDRRKNKLNELLKKTALEHNREYIGRKMRVLVEKFKAGKCLGKTDTYKTVIFSGDKKLIGQFIEVKIRKAGSWVLYG